MPGSVFYQPAVREGVDGTLELDIQSIGAKALMHGWLRPMNDQLAQSILIAS